jgi:hypothetical protein
MTQSIITAGDASNGMAYSGGIDGTLVLQSGPAGSKVNAISADASGKVGFPQGLSSATTGVYEEGTWTPVWTGNTTNPSLGNGTITGSYTRIGRLINATIRLTIGSTTTFGSGNYYFSLPKPVGGTGMAFFFGVRQGVGYYTLMGPVEVGLATTLLLANGGSGLSLNPTYPATWAATDVFTINVVYTV